jgi:1-acyl-sn-glycerol-3-phosphate acyltransferase
LLYHFIKIFAKIGIHLYCRHVNITNKAVLQSNGPILLAANHPNSFLDAIILCTLFKKPIYSLARGDAFKNKLAARILYMLKILPVYRVSEGVENLEENYKTFEACKEVFRKNGIVLIFSEGLCINEWHLRALKKGTARLAISSWQEDIPLQIIPVGINYSSFKKFGKNIKLFFGDPITASAIDYNNSHGTGIKECNTAIEQQLRSFVFEANKNDKARLKQYFFIPQPRWKKILLALPATVGWLIHILPWYFINWLSKKLIKDRAHYDSGMVGFAFFLYPVFLLLLSFIVYLFTNSNYTWLLLLALPFTAWAYVQVKEQMD